jgi:outer membrane protein TolC
MKSTTGLLTTLLLVSLLVFAPRANGQRHSRTDTTSHKIPDLPDSVVEKRLVILALSGPTFDASTHNNRINQLALRSAKSSWLNLLTISTSYYAQSGNRTVGQATYVLPQYYFTISIPLGIIFSQGNQIKTARESIALGKDRQEDLARTLRADVLGKYKQYKLNKTLIQMQSEMVDDIQASATQTEENFKKGTATVDAYISAQKARNDELIKSLNLHLQQDLLVLDIEKMIGVPLAVALTPGPLSAQIYYSQLANY